ncbi:E3 ubiquitin ligase RNF157 isoform X1 [Nematolebias whitei]|uniref:E3 ubiquitin ligase RNF157 isoform X1 n=1 Tax=Nematolebias whitei TaxID=451745 RepID=UPI001899B47F|nr:E3 ubiquitin ligase RNF157 isoform X1 [Nematolebias whitei]
MRKKLSPLTPTSFNPVITSQTSDSEEHSASEHIPPGYEAVSLLEALNGPLNTSSVDPPPPHSGPSHVSGVLPPYSSEPHPAPARSLSPLDQSNSSQGLKLKKSSSKSLSQNSSVLPEEEDEKSCSESDACRHKLVVDQQESGVTPDSENLTLSSSGAIDQSPCTGTPLSSTITSPEDPVSSSLAQSVMSMASSHSQHSHISADTMSSMSGSYLAGAEGEPVGDEGGEVVEENQDAPMESRGPLQQEAEFSKETKEQNYSLGVEEQDSEGNDVTEEDCSSPSNGKDLMYLGGYRPVLDPRPHHNSNINLEEQGAENGNGQSPNHPRRGPLIV